MKNEAIESLRIKPDGIYVDMTLGGGGHSREILNNLTTGKLFCFDQDMTAITFNKKQFENSENIEIINSNFEFASEKLQKDYHIAKVDGVLYDLGVSSVQIDNAERGFSYMQDGPLDMRMDKNQSLTAHEIINSYSFNDLSRIIFDYGDEKFAKNITRKIIEIREEKSIDTTLQLVKVIDAAIPMKFHFSKKGHLAKKTFQAIRIAVNDEIGVFERSLKAMEQMLNPSGRLVVIVFHSLEDRVCQRFMKNISRIDDELKKLPVVPLEFLPTAKIISRRAIKPTLDETAINSRSRSASMRVLEKI